MWARRLATFTQGLWRCRTFGWLDEKFRHMNVKRCRDTVEKINRRVLRLLLNTAHIGAVNVGIVRQPLLRNTAIYADPAHIPGDKRTSFHALKQPF
ncbi:hypothetical protein ACVWXO_000729 [Bradyrhizobium sp. LM2.7]